MMNLPAQVRDVLHERSAARDVQHLHPAADCQDRQSPAARSARQAKLEYVNLWLGWAELGMRVGAVASRLQVGSAGQADPVKAVDDRLEPPRGQRREDHRNASGGGDGFEIGNAE